MNKFKPKALIRVESNPEIGSGHAMRMLALTSMLHNHFDLYLAFREMPKATENLYLQFGVTLINLVDTNPDEELDFIHSKVNNLDIAIVDGYQSLDYFKYGCLEKKIKLVLIDDLLINNIRADLVINHSPGINESDYSPLNTTFCLGLDFALIQDCFLDQANSIIDSSHKDKGIFLSLGGSDPENLTPNLLSFLIRNTKANINCVLGPLNRNSDLIRKKFEDGSARIVFHNNISSEEIRKLMISSKIGICAASTISIEAISCRLPLIAGWSTQNQLRFYTEACHLGLARGIGNFEEINFNSLLATIEELISSKKSREEIIKKQIKYIDGKSPKRILNALNSVMKS